MHPQIRESAWELIVIDVPFIVSCLRAGITAGQICADHGLEQPKRHERFENLVQFKYDQIAMKRDSQLAQQCRGIILDEANNWNVVARPFDKFWNAEEPGAAKIDWASASVQEKVDGSLCIMYYYQHPKRFRGEWLVATTGRPDASGNVNGLSMTFDKLFWDTFNRHSATPDDVRFGHITFMFELTSPYNRVVVNNGAESRLTILGARNRITGQEYIAHEIAGLFMGIYPVRHFYGLQDLEQLGKSFETMNPLEQEGYVVVDANFNRIKVKHPGYVLAHKLRSSFSTKNALDAIRIGEAPEILAHFPEMKAEMDRIDDALFRFKAEVNNEFLRLKDIDVQKDFALEAVKTPMNGAPLFYMRAKKGTLDEFIKGVPLDKLVTILGLKESPPPLVAE